MNESCHTYEWTQECLRLELRFAQETEEHKNKVAESDKENTELEHIPTQAVIIWMIPPK